MNRFEFDLLVANGPSDEAELAASLLIAFARGVLLRKEHFDLVLTGGSTPIPLYSRLAAQHKRAIEWNRVRFFWGDERDVPPDHLDSNFRSANKTLLRPLGIRSENVFRIPAGGKSAVEAAAEYEATLKNLFSGIPDFDYVLLGIGEDGHIASLFPDARESWESAEREGRWVAASWVPHLAAQRITLLPSLLNHGLKVCILASGTRKSNIIREFFGREFLGREVFGSDPAAEHRYPAQLIHSRYGKPLWLLDREAASGLEISQAA